jgi:subtilisin-like proprotein convertase family protein
LDLKLISPDNTEITLELNVFSINCIANLKKSYPPTDHDSLNRLIGKQLNGQWTLSGRDHYLTYQGSLNKWNLTIQYTE